LQVSSLERAAAFYIDAFDGRWLARSVLLDGPSVATFMGGPPGTSVEFCKVGFDEGAVELFEFVGDARPGWAESSEVRRLPHFAIRVEDVPATLERVRVAGGTELWPDIAHWGSATSMYVTDLDGNVIEVTDVPLEDDVATTLRLFPAADPSPA
jgi:catechol 2,3-dioxygenase-like lactoylglutathione lyase family enzyme